MEHLRVCEDVVVPVHIPHRYSEEMSQKSSVTCLGTIDANPSSHEGTQVIMDALHAFVPQVGDAVLPVLVNGDGLSIDRMRTAKINRCRAPTPTARLEGLITSPQEFHLEALLLQVIT